MTVPAPPPPPAVTRIDAVHPPALVDGRALVVGIWRGRMRRFGALAAWLLVLLIILAVVVLGSRPAPTDFESLGWTLT